MTTTSVYELVTGRDCSEAFLHGPKVDDILSYSWGYDQTNIDWYKVTRVTAKSVELTPIAGSYEETGFMSGTTVPAPDSVIGVPFLKRFRHDNHYGYVIYMDYGIAKPWDGKPEYESHYA